MFKSEFDDEVVTVKNLISQLDFSCKRLNNKLEELKEAAKFLENEGSDDDTGYLKWLPRPQLGEEYLYIGETDIVYSAIWQDKPEDHDRYYVGNCFLKSHFSREQVEKIMFMNLLNQQLAAYAMLTESQASEKQLENSSRDCYFVVNIPNASNRNIPYIIGVQSENTSYPNTVVFSERDKACDASKYVVSSFRRRYPNSL